MIGGQEATIATTIDVLGGGETIELGLAEVEGSDIPIGSLV